MNAREKERILVEAGYVMMSDTNNQSRLTYYKWYAPKTSALIASASKRAMSASMAYDHYLVTAPSPQAPEAAAGLALQGDLYELVGLGLASPDLLVPNEVDTLRQQVATLQSELSAAKATLERVQKAAQDEKQKAKQNAMYASMGGDERLESYWSGIEETANYILSEFEPDEDETLQAPLSPEPPFRIGDTVRIASHIDQLRGEVVGMEGSRYLVKQSNGLTVVREAEELAPTEAPQEGVTLKPSELTWLATNWHRDDNLFRVKIHAFGAFKPDDKLDKIAHNSTRFYYYQLKPEFDTPANRAAIAAKSQELGLA